MSTSEITYNKNGAGSHMYCITPCPENVDVSLDDKVNAKLTKLHSWSGYVAKVVE